ncbi:hypothetical protein DSM43518_02998 [Mycobacterium marinum]|uniref:TIGR02611 family protein n=1 Tax=Mycobacterium shottsii TaxID=133549 RepID=A0A7I7LHP6_9MYCO|nr:MULTISPECIES: hypothetical protein [Mycobacterium ulcerans group]AXN44788.1 hypothetical protein MM1218R_02852 [Mycobacterium marinum]AXN50166.1 hypothetical protein CCUG20998_02761 [Mycobacterium marinum]EPQ80501.1 hypothetical protein MMEU_1026 [Mycobacterium marinum str. Europe]QYL28806.1 hypothetical protein TM48_03186 [Mycobacterium shottsii]RFZ03062.1 hypothetical protein VIMS_05456 [Mycobacterium marinum]
MDSGDCNPAATTRDAAFARVLAYRDRARAKPMVLRVLLAVFGAALLIASVPLMVLLPELGIPAVLVAFRVLAIESDWAARAYGWTDWRFAQLRDWFHRQSAIVRAAILTALLLVAAALVWVLIVEF